MQAGGAERDARAARVAGASGAPAGPTSPERSAGQMALAALLGIGRPAVFREAATRAHSPTAGSAVLRSGARMVLGVSVKAAVRLAACHADGRKSPKPCRIIDPSASRLRAIMSANEQAWAWVGPMYERYVQVEQHFFKSAVIKAREAEAAVRTAKAETEQRAQEIMATAEAHSQMSADRAVDALKRGKNEYPEAVVGGGLVAFNLLNGFGPRRSIFIILPALAFSVRSSLISKWGDDIAAFSTSASNATRAQLEAFGLRVE